MTISFRKAVCWLLAAATVTGMGGCAVKEPQPGQEDLSAGSSVIPSAAPLETDPPETSPETEPPPTGSVHAHNYSITLLSPSTCTEAGKLLLTCGECGSSGECGLGAPGHSYSEKTVEPTCTKEGYTLHTCTRCEDSYQDEETKPQYHSYTHEIIPGANGYTLHTCHRCGVSYKDGYGQTLSVSMDIPAEILDSYIMRAWKYIGMDVQSMVNNGTLFVKYGADHNAGIPYDSVTGGCMGYERVESGATVTGYAPNVARFRSGGLVCAGFVTYYLLNYLRWVEDIDCVKLREAVNSYADAHGVNCRGVLLWEAVLSDLADKGPGSGVQRIYQGSFDTDREIPGSVYASMKPGDIITFGKLRDSGGNSYAHIAVYAGTWNGKHFIIHQPGGSDGPRMDTVEDVGIIDSLMPQETYDGPYDHITSHPIGVYRLLEVTNHQE